MAGVPAAMKKKLSLVGAALVVVGSLTYTPAFTQDAKGTKRTASSAADGRPVSTKSVASRTALCKADCRPENYNDSGIGIHGLYRSYSKFDPHLVSVEGKKQYAECVQKCLAPLPTVYVQRAVFAMGINWFGKTKQSCLDCHVKGH
jgi:hypothetical protein